MGAGTIILEVKDREPDTALIVRESSSLISNTDSKIRTISRKSEGFIGLS